MFVWIKINKHYSVNTSYFYSAANEDIKCDSDFCYDARWSVDKKFTVDRPVIKDTVMIPNGGYAVVRFYTDNPGYWLGHCHQSEHLHEGK